MSRLGCPGLLGKRKPRVNKVGNVLGGWVGTVPEHATASEQQAIDGFTGR